MKIRLLNIDNDDETICEIETDALEIQVRSI